MSYTVEGRSYDITTGRQAILMKLHLKEIHLRNFRIHEDYVFDPAEKGITAIVGANGKGKSSIIDGLAWALYGTKPNTSIKNSSWRRNGAPEQEPSFVQVKLTLDGQEITVKRSIVNTRGGQQCECWLDGEQVAGPAVSHAKKWIVSTLGLDENSFLSTILVQQKHVDELVSASPSERRRLLERLTGIEAVSKALDNAKAEKKMYSSAVDSIGLNEDKLPALKKEEETNLKKAEKISKEVKVIEDKLAKINETGKELSTEVKQLDAVSSEMSKLNEETAVLEDRVEELSSRVSELSDRKTELKKGLPEVMASTSDITDMKNELSTLEGKLRKLRNHEASLNAILKAAPSDADMKRNSDETNRLNDEISKIDEAGLNEKIDKITDEINMARAMADQAKKSMGELGDGVNTCPTCLQPIDDVDHVRKELDETVSDANAKIKSITPELKESKRKLEDLNGLKIELEELKRQSSVFKDQVKSAVKADEDMIDVKANITSTEAEVASYRKIIGKFDADSVKRGEYERTSKDLMRNSDALSKAKEDLVKVKAKVKERGKGYSDSKLRRLRDKLDKMRARKSDLKTDLAGKRGDVRVLKTQADSARRAADTLEEQMKNRSDLLSKLEVSEGTVGILDVFKEHVILSAIPQVTDYASDLVMKISDGRFVSVTIDGDFNIRVEGSDGMVFDVSQLSGGETSLVAICIRLAISVMLSGGSPSLLVLDEVLTAMDSDRAQAILESMQDMAGDGQIIIVAHNEVVKSIADKVIDLNE